MTSRDVSGTRLPDQLDVKIRCVLRASVADARLPSRVWGRIVERLSQQAVARKAERWRGLIVACQGLVLWLFDSVAEPPAEFACCYSPGLGDRWDKDYLRLLVYRCDLPQLLAQAM